MEYRGNILVYFVEKFEIIINYGNVSVGAHFYVKEIQK
ncbi:hypothetical protein SAMN06264849_11082 [Melghirimyces algeriensis]|uniref:Uncharacterized protein n=1 Tax=Melghirimyces algeriensis TaxID=910412 RepID=A0A521ERL2_9BACL|nr:hypothetical protein SAMN06264849_11082 [Melghirimyces algeriensis]